MINFDRTNTSIFLLIQVAFWMFIWLANDYLAVLLTLIFAPILFGVLIVSFIADKLDKSFVGKKYYLIMTLSFLIPSIIFLLFITFVGFEIELFD